MKFSVIITTYNRANIVQMCLNSLIKQNYPKSDYEIIIVDNNSTDNTKEVSAKYIKENPGNNIKYYFVPRPGQVYARQAGILAAQNEILCFTDDDGILDTNWLREIAKVFSMNDEAVGVAGKIKIKWDETPPDWIYDYEPHLGKLDYGDDVKFEVGMYMNAGNLSIKKDVLIEVGGFNPEMVGEWLVGDGETGLWRKLRQKNYLIGWAPDALMEHYQIVKKNATVADIKRRFMNNGICIPYSIYAVDKEGIGKLISNMFFSIKRIFRWTYRKTICALAGNKKGEYNAIFRRAFYLAQVSYSMKIIFNKKFRNEITKEDWIVKQKPKKVMV